MTSAYYKYAIAAVIVFDLSRPSTFDAVLKVLSRFTSSKRNRCSGAKI